MSRPCWQVSELFDGREPSVPRYIIAHRRDQRPWMATWERRWEIVNSRLACWLQTLSEPPGSRLVLGLYGISEATAVALASWMIGRLQADGASLCNSPMGRGGRRPRRPVAIIRGGQTVAYPSQHAAARALGISQPAVVKMLRTGRAF
jgi:hypothetical protein